MMRQTKERLLLLCLWVAGTLLLLPMSWLALTTVARAQTAAAGLNGTVRDPSGAVIPEARVVLLNTATGVRQTTTTNPTGSYVFPNIPPGNYTLEVTKEGFTRVEQAEFTLFVNQTATFDITLSVGSAKQTVTVEATAARVEASTAELGMTVAGDQVGNLPLNGRDFTQLLTLSPGVSPINTDQNGGGWLVNPVGSFSFPAVNGQMNRSNMFTLDGVIDYGSFTSTYGVAPIVDGIQEFKAQSQNDEAQFGGALGAIVNVVTRSGSNDFHGSAWEFLRNNSLNARNYFATEVTPFKQNQFGGAIGGPVIFPRYNGRNRTFFYAGYEGFRLHSSSESLFNTPTPADLTGDLSDIDAQIYNPFSTRPDPNNPDLLLRDPFPDNQIPSNLLDPGMVLWAKTLYPTPNRNRCARLQRKRHNTGDYPPGRSLAAF